MMHTTKRIEDLAAGDIARVYQGATGRCYCGCAGTYHESVRMKETVVGLMKATPGRVQILPIVMDDETILTLERADGSGREYTAYLRAGIAVTRDGETTVDRIAVLENALRRILSGDYPGGVIKGARKIAEDALADAGAQQPASATLCSCGHESHGGGNCSHRDPEDGVGCDCTNGYETQEGSD